MNYQTAKFTGSTRKAEALPAEITGPMYSSPWLALYLHLKANLNQSSAS